MMISSMFQFGVRTLDPRECGRIKVECAQTETMFNGVIVRVSAMLPTPDYITKSKRWKRLNRPDKIKTKSVKVEKIQAAYIGGILYVSEELFQNFK